MQADDFDWYKFNYLIILLIGFLPIVHTTKLVSPVANRQMCTKIQSMLSNGRYQTTQTSSNITYMSRLYAQNFLAYSPADDILIFVEPKYQLHVYNAQSIRLIVNITTTNVVYAASCISLSTGDRHDICFVYESLVEPNMISIRICEVRFNMLTLDFEDKKCIETLTIRSNQTDIRIHGFTIKRDHDRKKKSLLFISSDIGLIYTIFDTRTSVLIQKPEILNDTLCEGSVVVTSSGVIYYANKEEHTIHELRITADFRIRFGKIIKSNAIRFPFGLITDECDHLYIATKSMILVMYIQTYKTIRSVFSKASDLPITLERLNSTTYVYTTVKKSVGKLSPTWMFNFLYFSDPLKPIVTTQPSVITNITLDFDDIHNLSTYSTMATLSSSTPLNGSQNTSELSTFEYPNDMNVSLNESQQTTNNHEDTLSLSTEYSVEHLLQSTSTNTPLNMYMKTSLFNVTPSSSASSEKYLTIQEQSTMTEFNSVTSTVSADSIIKTSSKNLSDINVTHAFSYSTLSEESVTASSTLHVASLFIVSNSSLVHPSTAPAILKQFISSKTFSVSTTSETILHTTLQTGESSPTLDTTQQSSMITFPDETSSPSMTSYPTQTSIASTLLSTTITDQFTSQFLGQSTVNDETSSIAITTAPTRSDDSSAITSWYSEIESSTTLFDIYNPTTKHSTVITIHSSPPSSQPSSRRRTSRLTTTTPITSAAITTTRTTTDLYQTRRSKIPRFRSRSSTTINSFVQTTAIYHPLLTTSSPSIWYSKFDSYKDQHIMVIKPSLDSNLSNTLLSDDLLTTLFNNTINNSSEKSIYFNLKDLPPSSWNLSLHTNDSVLLDIALPYFSNSFDSHKTTNLTITNVDANRFTTNITGAPIHLQIDQIQAKHFSLAMNLTNNQSNQPLSDIIIGHVRSEQFHLDITKSDNMNIHVTQVDSETAELFFDSQFCTNETNLQINLNLSKNGTIRYGDRPPIRIGSVFARVYMLKQSCELDQPFTLFFDICQQQNPCLNDGTCQSNIPDYNSPSYSHQESSEINYQCLCPMYISGEHCQHSLYPLGYCINGGSLIYTLDVNNKSKETCLCAPGFQGHHCENNIDDCRGILCSNHGICQDRINTYTCSCFDGYYGTECEQVNVQTVILQAVRKSFATVAILLIASIGGLAVASDIHTYLTRKKQTAPYQMNRFPRGTSELFENSVLLLGFGEAPIEMSDLSIDHRRGKTMMTKPQQSRKRKKKRSYQHVSKRKLIRTLQNPTPRRYLFVDLSDDTLL